MSLKSAKNLSRSTLDSILKAWGQNNAKSYDIRNTIAVASSGRGGSTWLAELIGTLAGYPIIWEPLHLGKNPECEQYGFDWQTYIPSYKEEQQKKAYLKQLLTGANLSTAVVSSLAFEPYEFLRFRGFLVKFVCANLLLHWMLHQFPIRAILMIRHPCAVVSSQLCHSAWNDITKENITFPQNLADDFPHLREIYYRIETTEEVLAFEWALQTYIPLVQQAPHPWYLTTYEKLINDGKDEVNRHI